MPKRADPAGTIVAMPCWTGVIEAANADEALLILAAVPRVGAVVTDVEMPNGSINGYELAHRVLRDWNIGVLIASGRSPPGEPLPSGSHFLSKPYRSDDVIETVKALLKISHL
jgi:CheY-like chemotaxis protein